MEAIETLEGRGPADLLDLTLHLGNELLIGKGVVPTVEEAVKLQRRIIDSGAAAAKFWEMIAAQGGQPHVLLETANAIYFGPFRFISRRTLAHGFSRFQENRTLAHAG